MNDERFWIPFEMLEGLISTALEVAAKKGRPLDYEFVVFSLVVDIHHQVERTADEYALLWYWPIKRVEEELPRLMKMASVLHAAKMESSQKS